MIVLPFALKGDALDEYNQSFHGGAQDGAFKNVSSVIKMISRRLENAEFKMENKNSWSSMTLESVRIQGEPLEHSFSRLKKEVRKLQSRLGGDHNSDTMFCDFFRHALQDEPFWTYVDDSDPKITSEVMFSKVNLAIQRYQREIRRSLRRKKTIMADVPNKRFGVPENKRIVSHKNPKYRDGTIMQCTGCGPKDHLYRECKNPNKASYREKRIVEINSMRGKARK